MKNAKLLILLGLGLMMAPKARAAVVNIHVGIGAPVVFGPTPVVVGAPPVCAYGYYDYYPYACAPYGFYAPNYFVNGVFIGAGPWFHGFRGGPVFHPAPARFDHRWVAPARPTFQRGFDRRGFDSHPVTRGTFRGGAHR